MRSFSFNPNPPYYQIKKKRETFQEIIRIMSPNDIYIFYIISSYTIFIDILAIQCLTPAQVIEHATKYKK